MNEVQDFVNSLPDDAFDDKLFWKLSVTILSYVILGFAAACAIAYKLLKLAFD